MKVRILRPRDSLKRAFVIFPTRQSDLQRELIVYTTNRTERVQDVPIDGRMADRRVRDLLRQGYRITDGGPSEPVTSTDRIEVRHLEQLGPEGHWEGYLFRDGTPASGKAAHLGNRYIRLGLDVPVSYGARGSSRREQRGVYIYRVTGHKLEMREVGDVDIQEQIDQHLRAIAQVIQPNARGQFNWIRFLNQLSGYPAADVKDAFAPFAAAAQRSWADYLQRSGRASGPFLPLLRVPERFTQTVPVLDEDQLEEQANAPKPEPPARFILPPDRPRKIDLE